MTKCLICGREIRDGAEVEKHHAYWGTPLPVEVHKICHKRWHAELIRNPWKREAFYRRKFFYEKIFKERMRTK